MTIMGNNVNEGRAKTLLNNSFQGQNILTYALLTFFVCM